MLLHLEELALLLARTIQFRYTAVVYLLTLPNIAFLYYNAFLIIKYLSRINIKIFPKKIAEIINSNNEF